MRIEVICTGDEVLTGKIVNTNFSYITQKLEDFGLAVSWETTVGDDRENLLLAFRLAGERADAVIVPPSMTCPRKSQRVPPASSWP
jgi:nicotinamide-nucleotide amidase